SLGIMILKNAIMRNKWVEDACDCGILQTDLTSNCSSSSEKLPCSPFFQGSLIFIVFVFGDSFTPDILTKIDLESSDFYSVDRYRQTEAAKILP
ncbi:hypothetical protein STEG23_009462, partial [Scotinomys teguina]